MLYALVLCECLADLSNGCMCLQADAIYMNFGYEGVLGAGGPGPQQQLQHAGGTPLHLRRTPPSLARLGVESDMLSSISSANTASLHNGSDQVLDSLVALRPRSAFACLRVLAFLFAVIPTARFSLFRSLSSPFRNDCRCSPMFHSPSTRTFREPTDIQNSSPVRSVGLSTSA